MGGMSSSFGGLGDAMTGLTDVASVAAAPETGGLSLAALAPAVASSAGGIAQYMGAQDTNQTTQNLANQANAFSAQQFATRYQTTVADLKAAGLNPMLAYGQGGGSPPSAVGIAQQTNPMAGMSDMATKAVGAANTSMDTQVKDAQVTNTISQTGVNEAQRKNIAATTSNTEADTYLKILEAPNVPQKTKLLVAQTLQANAQAGASSASEANTKMDTLIKRTGDLPEATVKGQQFQSGFDPLTQKRLESGVSTAVNAAKILSPLK